MKTTSLVLMMNQIKVILILCFSLLGLNGYSQNEANIWYFGDYAGVSFDSGIPIALTDGALSTREGCATISDSNGNLLFYTEGTTIWNSNHVIMMNGTGLLGDYSSTQSAIIVPQPLSASIYYVFTVPGGLVNNNNANLCYSVVDMNQNGGLGAVILKNVVLYGPITERVTAVVHSNGEDIWVISHERNSNGFCSFLITSGGVNPSAIMSYAGTVHSSPASNYVGYLKSSPMGNYLACAVEGPLSMFEMFDFNRENGQVTNPITFNGYGYAYGLEFSPDESKLYLGVALNQPEIFQVNLNAGTSDDIINSATSIGITPLYPLGALQIGPDQKIYVTFDFSEYLGVINNPNQLGIACDFDDEAVYLAGRNGRFGLPTFIQSYFSANISYQNTCFGQTTTFSIQTSDPIQSILWNFGDPASGSNNTSTLENPSHIFTSPGSYTVTATVVIDGVSQEFTVEVQIIEAPPINLGDDTSICSGGSITLDAGPGFNSYMWNTGATTQTITVSTAGTYDVTGTFQDCTSTDAILISVVPQASGDAGSDEMVCQGQPLNFANSAVQPTALNYSDILWSGGMGTFNNPHTLWPIYTPDIIETGNITLIMEVFSVSPCPSITSSMILTIGGSADADFNVLPGFEVCVLTQQTFSGTSTSNIVSWTWDFGDGSANSYGQNVVHTYPYAGTYVVQLEVTSADGCMGTVSHIVTITSAPSAGFFTTPTSPVCINQQIAFTDISSNDVVSWMWNFGDGTFSAMQNPAHSYLSDGNYTAQLTVTNQNGCINTISNLMEVVKYPDAQMILSPGTTICAQSLLSVQGIDQNGTNIVSWQWNFGDGSPITSGQISSHVYNIPGTYIVELSVINNGGCTDLVTHSVLVQDIPVADFLMFPSDSACIDELITFTDNSTNDVVSWSWDFGDGVTNTLQNPDHSYSNAGLFDIELIVTNQNSCTDTLQSSIQIFQLPDAQINVTPGSTVCANSPLNFRGLDQNETTVLDWQWNFGDGGYSEAKNPVYTYTNPGNYYVQLTVTSILGCRKTIAFLTPVEAYPLPDARFYPQPDVTTEIRPEFQFFNISDNYVSSYWIFGDGDSSIYTGNPIHTFPGKGVYNVALVVISNHGCLDTLIVPVNIIDEFSLYVPTAFSPDGDGSNEFFKPYGSGIAETNYYFIVFDRWGMKVFETKDYNQTWDGKTSGEKAKTGIYTWVLFYKDLIGNGKTSAGTVTLLR